MHCVAIGTVRRHLAATIVLTAIVGVCPQAYAQDAEPRPFGHTCIAQNSVRFCPTPTPTALSDERVPSFDGVPLDVDVTLPARGRGPFPTIVLLHGYGGDKTSAEASQPNGGSGKNNIYQNNSWYARNGYAVVNPTMRGFGDSCGSPATRTLACVRGWHHMADQRYEARDVQFLLGRLVDEGIAERHRLGVNGCSYGSVVSIELAMLRDRVRLEDGTFTRWRSPRGIPLELGAAYSRCSISALVTLAIPNGRFLDFEAPALDQDRTPIGVTKALFPLVAYAASGGVAYVSPPFVDPTADYNRWTLTGAASDDPNDPETRRTVDELAGYHQGLGLLGIPAPLLIEDGWTDEITPPSTGGLRLYTWLRANVPSAKISLQIGDVGHQRGQGKGPDQIAFRKRSTAFFDHYLKGKGAAPAPWSVMALTQTCAADAPSAGPFRARTWAALHPGAVRAVFTGERTVVSGSGDQTLSAQIDPLVLGGTGCRAFDATDAPGTATYTYKVRDGFTMLGLPTMRMRIEMSGEYGQLAARLWDVGLDGKQTLVTRGMYRLTRDQRGTITWQMFGGGYRFERGHTARLELLGSDSPYFRTDRTPFTVAISKVELELPTLERPGHGAIVKPVIERAR
jgi:pimeloyl-ACP methyl ester carboxylesterase